MLAANFTADFSKFNAAVDKASVKIKDWEDDLSRVGRTLSRFGDQFSGTKVIQDAIAMEKAIDELGGVSKLTATELQRAGSIAGEAIEKMNRLGTEVPPKLQTLANSIKVAEKELKDLRLASEQAQNKLTLMGRAAAAARSTFGQMFAGFTAASLIDRAAGTMVNFAKQTFDSAGAIADLAQQTGLSTRMIQELQFVAGQTGSSLETLTGAANKLGLNIAKGTEEAQKAIEDLGLSWDAIRAMGKEDQFAAVLTAAGKLQDEAKRTVALNALVGKSYDDFTGVALEDFDKIRSKAAVTADDQIQELAKLGDEWDKFLTKLEAAYRGTMGKLVIMTGDFGMQAARVLHDSPLLGELKDIADFFLQVMNTSIDEIVARDIVAKLKKDLGLDDAPPPPSKPGESEKDKKAREDRERANQRAADERKRQQEAFAQKQEDMFRGDINAAEDLARLIGDVTRIYELSNDQQIQYFKTLNAGFDQAIRRGETLSALATKMRTDLSAAVMGIELPEFLKKEREGIGAPGWVPPMPDLKLGAALQPPIRLAEELTGKIVGLTDATAVFGQGLKMAMLPPPNSINAFEGVFSGIKSSFKDLWKGMSGGEGMSGLFKNIGKQLTDSLTNMGLSAAMSFGMQGLQKLGSKLFKTEGKATNKERDKWMRDNFGSQDQFEKLAAAAGVTADQIHRFETVGDRETFNRMAQGIQAVIDKFQDAEQAAADATAELAKSRADWLKSVGGSEESFRRLAKQAGITDAEIDKIFNTDKIEDFDEATQAAQEKLDRFAREQEEDAERLEKAIEKYGFAWDELGKNIQQKKLDEQAKDLIEDWRVLIEAGVDLGKVNAKMSDHIEEYLKLAKQTGAEVPAAMRPMLQKMIESGVLTDANGKKIEHLEDLGVTFAQTMTQGFDRIVEKLEELIRKIGGVGDALDDIPDVTEKVIRVRTEHVGDDGDTTHGGGTDPDSGDDEAAPYSRARPSSFLAPLNFQRGTGGRFLDFGEGTPAMLHGHERVVTGAEARGENADVAAMVTAVQGLQTVLLRAVRENALQVRDQALLARA